MDNDLISRSALLKTIKEKIRPDKYGTGSQVLKAMGSVIHIIRTQPAVRLENGESGNISQEAESAIRKSKKAYSFDGETYFGNFATDIEALDEALREIEAVRKHATDDVPDSVYIGACEIFEPYISGWNIIEAAVQQADDEGFSEWDDNYLSDVTKEQCGELEEELDRVFKKWIDKYNHHATFFRVNSYNRYFYDKDKHGLFIEIKGSDENIRNIHLWHIGRDSHSRPVYKDEQGKLWKDVNPKADCPVKLCSTLDNAFDGEPDTPMEYMEHYQNVKVHFIPKRDIWQTEKSQGERKEDSYGCTGI